MNMSTPKLRANILKSAMVGALLAVSGGGQNPALAALTDISNAPITSTTSAQLKPNIMLLMDTSGSMGWGHMPDEIESITGPTSIGYKSAQCNLLFYKPSQAYDIPKQPNGDPFAAPSFTAAPYSGFVSYTGAATVLTPGGVTLTAPAGNIDLSSSFQAYDDFTLRTSGFSDTAQPAYYYVYSGPEVLSPSSPACRVADTGAMTTATPGGGTWTRKLVSATSGPGASDERQNFANWYSFYRTRIALIKSAVSLAFTPLTDSFRVGFVTMIPKLDVAVPTSTFDDNKFVPISDFNSIQRSTWYSKLFAQTPKGSSPAREGLARVGRHYAGRADSINTGMSVSPDPVQYYCQQNFTIMTTDGYWNDQAENGGPVQLDGSTLVGNQDGTLTDDAGNVPRPIWEGGTQTVTKVDTVHQYGACAPYYIKATVQNLMNTSQNLQSTVRNLQSTSQALRSTNQNLRSTVQNVRNTSQTVQTTVQNRQSTTQRLRSTNQNLRSTVQNRQTTTQITQLVTIARQSTVQNLRSTVQNRQSTSQNIQRTTQNLRSTVQNLRSTNQNLANTSQNLQSTTQMRQSTTQTLRSTTQMLQSTTQVSQSTSQIKSCNSLTEICSFVATCSAGGNITCQTIATGPTFVASCTAAAASSANNYTTTTCTPNNTSNVPVASCTASAATAGNNYTATTCTPNNTSNVPVASCAAASASSANGYTTTTCTPINTSNVPVSSCTASAATAGNNYTTTTCSPNNTSNVPVATCTASAATAGNSWTTTTCPAPIVQSNVPVASCTVGAGSSANNYVNTTSCPAPVVTTSVPVATCTAATASAGNSWTTTTCPAPVTTSNVPVATCTASAATSANSWTTTTCPAPIVVNTPVATCTAVAASAGNSWTATTCPAPVVTTNVPVATCTASAATLANSWTTTTCPAPVVTTNVPIATCTASAATSANSWTTTTCPAPNTTTNVAVASCTASAATSGNSWTTTTCPAVTVVSGPTPVASCTPVAPTAANGFQNTTCPVNTATTNVATCTPVAASAGNNWTAITCPAPITTTNVPVATCTASAATAANSWVTTTCPPPNVTTNVPVASCTAAAAASGNSWTTTTCPAPITTTNVPVATCTAASATAANSFVATTCPAPVTVTTPVQTCTPVAAAAGNSWTATTCPAPVTTTNVPVATCTAAVATAGNSWTETTCPAPITTTDVPVASCTPATAASGNSWTTTTCPAPVVTTNVPVASCTAAAAASGNNWTTTTCPAPVTTSNVPVASCSPVAAAAGNNWTSTSCPAPLTTTNVPVATCTPETATAGNTWTTTTCPAPIVNSNVPTASCTVGVGAGPQFVNVTACPDPITTESLPGASCSPVAAASANNWTATTCTPVPRTKLQVSTTTTVTSSYINGSSYSTTVTPPTPVYSDVDGICYLPGTEPVLPDPVSTSSTVNPGGSSNSLADVAQYYYATDLRSSMVDKVKHAGSGPEDDRADWQHMTTFAIGLGVSGTLNYSKTYRSDLTGDFADIRSKTISKAWPQWPDPALDYSIKDNWNNAKSIDDFWHAAVNGRGQYFSAGSPTDVISGLSGALAGINASSAAGSAAGASSLTPVAGDNTIYIASYVTSDWTGDVTARSVDIATGVVSTTVDWSAQLKLDAQTGTACDNRKVYLIKQGATNNLLPFTWGTKACDVNGAPTGTAANDLTATEKVHFATLNTSLLSQYPSMTDGTGGKVDQRTPAEGANMVNFLRGQRGFEGFVANDVSKLYRTRKHVLGDIINSSPVYVKTPFASYQDSVTPTYQSFKDANASRRPMVYFGGNDGMLHALYATAPNAGEEAWAVIPSSVLPNLYKLADNDYGNTHRYFVDGTPSVGDIYTGTAWKTILVGGLNLGGKGFYALDVTDPDAPEALWEFNLSSTCYSGTPIATDCHIGYTFGAPLITKVDDGTTNGKWVVLVTSGYNNVNSPSVTGDGGGYLYVLDATNGQILHKIATGVGSSTTPSGLAHVTNFVDTAIQNNLTLRVYGGDLLGNIWRFDVNGTIDPVGREATLVGTAKDAAGVAQPITIRPRLAEINSKTMLLVGTGRLLGATDLPDVQTQSVYGVIDPLSGSPAYADLRGSLAPLAMTQTGTPPNASRTAACTGSSAVCAPTNGWVLDLPDAGERVNVGMELTQGVLVFGSNVPSTSACDIGGYSWLNFVDFRTGINVGNAPNVATWQASSLIVGINILSINGVSKGLIMPSDGSTPPTKDIPQGISGTGAKRITWREIAK